METLPFSPVIVRSLRREASPQAELMETGSVELKPQKLMSREASPQAELMETG